MYYTIHMAIGRALVYNVRYLWMYQYPFIGEVLGSQNSIRSDVLFTRTDDAFSARSAGPLARARSAADVISCLY